MQFDRDQIGQLERSYRRNLMNSLLGYKHALLIGSVSEEGRQNLAIFTQVIHVGAAPPLLGVLFRPHTVARHTLENIRATNCFTINQISDDIVTEAHQTSANYPPHVSEFDATGIAAEIIAPFAAPFVSAAGVKVACSLSEELLLEQNGTILVIGAVEWVYVADYAVGQDGFINHQALQSVAAAGLDAYYKGEVVTRLQPARIDP